jgi:hypothetical protein
MIVPDATSVGARLFSVADVIPGWHRTGKTFSVIRGDNGANQDASVTMRACADGHFANIVRTLENGLDGAGGC